MPSDTQSENGSVDGASAGLGPWTPLVEYPHCCERKLNGKRVALIEKSPRVLNPTTGAWEYGPKGAGGTDSEKNKVNGYYPPSREWADARLAQLYGSTSNLNHEHSRS